MFRSRRICFSKFNSLIRQKVGNMTKEELEQWWILREQVLNGWHMSENDKKELIRLNHLVLEASQDIHNSNMLGDW